MQQVFQTAGNLIGRNVGRNYPLAQDQTPALFDAPYNPSIILAEDLHLKPPIDVEFHIEKAVISSR